MIDEKTALNIETFLEIFLLSKKDGSNLYEVLKRAGTEKQRAAWEPILMLADYLYEAKGEEYMRRTLKEFLAREKLK